MNGRTAYSMMRTVPVIDIEPARTGSVSDRRGVATAIDAACREIGFFAITGHGVAEPLIGLLERCMARDPSRRPADGDQLLKELPE